jgi:hypothetical protein
MKQIGEFSARVTQIHVGDFNASVKLNTCILEISVVRRVQS